MNENVYSIYVCFSPLPDPAHFPTPQHRIAGHSSSTLPRRYAAPRGERSNGHPKDEFAFYPSLLIISGRLPFVLWEGGECLLFYCCLIALFLFGGGGGVGLGVMDATKPEQLADPNAPLCQIPCASPGHIRAPGGTRAPALAAPNRRPNKSKAKEPQKYCTLSGILTLHT